MNSPAHKHLSFEDRLLIEKLAKEGLSGSQIALKMNRGPSTINYEFRKSGGIKEYSAEKGQKRSDEILEKKNLAISAKLKGNTHNSRFIKRIENLEMQVEILHESLKEFIKQSRNI